VSNLSEKINADLKSMMLARDEFATTVLRGLKSAILYEELAKNKRDEGLNESELLAVIARQVKQRDDAIALYISAGDTARAQTEAAEKEILTKYLPAQISDEELKKIAEKIVAENDFTLKDMGRAIGAVKAEVGLAADGARVAVIVKELLK
jgi:uncharacterized protein YqeY